MYAKAGLLTLLAAAVAQAQSTTSATDGSSTTISAWGVDASDIAASVISADACKTTLEIGCTNTDSGVCATIGSISYTFVQEASAFQIMYSGVVANGAQATGSDSCTIQSTSSTYNAVCVVSASASYDGQSTATKTTVTASNISQAPITVTAGANKLASGTCTSSGNGAVPTVMAEVYKVLVPAGAALLGAAML